MGMRAEIYHWYEGKVNDGEIIDIENLQLWIEEHGGTVQIRPPAVTGLNQWIIIITDKTNRFMQR